MTQNKRILWWLVLILGLGGAYGAAQSAARFHRYARTNLDSQTAIEVVKDAATQTCWAVFVVERAEGAVRITDGVRAIAATTLGVVACQPIPVPGAKPPVPASAIR